MVDSKAALLHGPRERYGGLGDASKNLFLGALIKNTHQKKRRHLRIFLYSDILNFTYKNQRDRSSYSYTVDILMWGILI